MNTNIKHCPRCGCSDILSECYFGRGIDIICERCEWSFTIFDDGDADSFDIDRMLRDKQTRFERKSPRYIDSDRDGRLVANWPPYESRGRDTA